MSVKEIEAEILRLSPKEQAYLFEKLAVLLDPDEEDPLTLEELNRRGEELRSGKVKGVTPEEMIAAAKRLL